MAIKETRTRNKMSVFTLTAVFCFLGNKRSRELKNTNPKQK